LERAGRRYTSSCSTASPGRGRPGRRRFLRCPCASTPSLPS
jgi:hypothetical protein